MMAEIAIMLKPEDDIDAEAYRSGHAYLYLGEVAVNCNLAQLLVIRKVIDEAIPAVERAEVTRG
jgi:hypothetical protein